MAERLQVTPCDKDDYAVRLFRLSGAIQVIIRCDLSRLLRAIEMARKPYKLGQKSAGGLKLLGLQEGGTGGARASRSVLLVASPTPWAFLSGYFVSADHRGGVAVPSVWGGYAAPAVSEKSM
jgi:hypothetical protein